MAIIEASGGTVTADGTEQTLATVSGPGTFQFVVDLANMANGDVLVLRLKSKVRSGSTAKTVYRATFAHAQGSDILLAKTPPLPAPHQVVATLQQAAGTNRNFEWSVINYDGEPALTLSDGSDLTLSGGSSLTLHV